MPFIGLFVYLLTSSLAFNAPVEELKPIPNKLVVLTFDDCNKSDRTFVAGIIKRHGFNATFYVTEGLGFLNNKAHYTTWEEIRELHDMGFEIGNHTKAHRNVRSLTKQQLHASLDHIDLRCAQFGIPKPVTFCYPGFSHSLQAVKVLDEGQYLFARRGVSPEYGDGGRGGRGPAYDPKLDHPLLVPTTWYSGPDSGFEDMKWAVSQAKEGKITVLCFHGVPALEHPWVNTEQQDFIRYMKYLKQSGCTVISMRELAKYVDPYNRPDDPYAITRTRTSLLLKRAQNAKANQTLKDTVNENEKSKKLHEEKRNVSNNWIDLYEAHVGYSMPYRLLKPLGFDIRKRYPVIVSLHGAGGRGKDNRKQLKDWNKLLTEKQRRADFPCYVLAPQTTRLWNGADLKNIKLAIAGLPAVDMDRIYILGHSMGGHGTYILIQIDTGYFAAAAPSAGSGRHRTEEFIDASLIKDIPIWAFHGDNDKVCPIERDRKLFAEMKKLGGNMKFTTWAGDGHAISKKMIIGGDNGSTQFSSDRCDRATDFMRWLFKQKRLGRQR